MKGDCQEDEIDTADVSQTSSTTSGSGKMESDGGRVLGEADPTGRNRHEPGAKLDAGKTPIFQGAIDYFPKAIEAVAGISAFGASKYAWKGWITVPDGINRYSNALVRHIISEAKGEIVDRDSGLLHAAHAAWNALAVLELKLRELQ